MFSHSFNRESPLHLAVIQNNIEEVAILAQKETLCRSVNQLGFTPVELAHFFGSQACRELLDPHVVKGVKAILKGENQPRDLTPIEFRQIFGVTYQKNLRFADYSTFKKVIGNCPLILKFFGSENRNLGSLYREQLTTGFTENLLIKWIGKSIGYGIFSLTDITEGAYIGEYIGLVHRLFRFRDNSNAYCFHYPTRFWSWKYFTVDALKEGNLLRFINHSDHPNLQPMCLLDRGLLHLVFFANRPIAKGTQLTFDYGDDYWIRRQKIPELST